MKKAAVFMCLMLGIHGSALGKEVTVTGVGPDQGSALNDAKRNAVEQVIGTYIDSRTLVDKAVVALDEIYAKSYGFVRNIQILEEGKKEALTRCGRVSTWTPAPTRSCSGS